jgi:pyruvate formate lyase activating enzyme
MTQDTGVSNRLILENLARIAASRTPLRIRLPLIPGFTDGDDNIAAVIRLADPLETVEGIDLLPFHRIGGEKYQRLGLTNPMMDVTPPSAERVADIQTRLESAGFQVTIGG